MLYELNHYEAMTLQDACEVAQREAAENAKVFERSANNQRFSESQRASAARVAKWHQDRAATFEAIRKTLDHGREITTLEQAKEALER